MTSISPWQNTPRKAVVTFLLAVFFVFTTFGFASDIIDLGRQPAFRFAVSVLFSGLFAVAYAATGTTLRGQCWKGVLPLFVVQFVSYGLAESMVSRRAGSSQFAAAELGRLQSRLTFDGLATIAAVCLGYVGFVYVSISEGQRHVRAQSEKAALESEMAAAREVQQLILPAQGESFPGYLMESVYQPPNKSAAISSRFSPPATAVCSW